MTLRYRQVTTEPPPCPEPGPQQVLNAHLAVNTYTVTPPPHPPPSSLVKCLGYTENMIFLVIAFKFINLLNAVYKSTNIEIYTID